MTLDDRQRWFLDRLARFRAAADSLPDRTMAQVRTLFEEAANDWNTGWDQGVTWQRHEVAGAFGPTPLLIVRPDGADGAIPACIIIHGGAFVIGSGWAMRTMLAALARRTGQAMLAVDPVLAPEHVLADQIADVAAAVRAIHESAAALGIDPGALSLAGESAGACLALMAGLRLHPEVRLCSLVLICGALAPGQDATDAFGSPDQEAIARMWATAIPDPAHRQDPRLVPSHAALQGLPPTLLLAAAEDDFLRDSILMQRRFADADVALTFRCVAGATHGFLALAEASMASRDGLDMVSTHLVAGASDEDGPR